MHERERLSAALGREPTAHEFAEHVLERLHADQKIRAMAVEAARQATAAAGENG
jgi:hypothetical protein